MTAPFPVLKNEASSEVRMDQRAGKAVQIMASGILRREKSGSTIFNLSEMTNLVSKRGY